MTTYPLSEPATTYANDDGGMPTSRVLFKGTLSDCAANAETMPHNKRFSASIKMDALDLSYGPDEVDELIRYLRNEEAGLSDKEIAELARKIE